MNALIPQKVLCLTWGPYPITTKTMRRERKRWGLVPRDFDGLQPLFDPDDVERAKKRRLEARQAQVV